jgi:hypothetical protein
MHSMRSLHRDTRSRDVKSAAGDLPPTSIDDMPNIDAQMRHTKPQHDSPPLNTAIDPPSVQVYIHHHGSRYGFSWAGHGRRPRRLHK